jgi:chorismate mutase
MLCAQEIPVPDGLPRCIRLLLHWNTELPVSQIVHVYLGAAASLRPDINHQDILDPF